MGKKLYCSHCKDTKDESEFTNFNKNPNLKDRNGKVVFCKDCCSQMVEEQGNSKEALKEVLRLIDIPYLENFADTALKSYKKKIDGTNIVIKQNVYDADKITEGIEKVRSPFTIYSCYTARLGLIPKQYINFSFSDGIREDKPVEKKSENIETKDKKIETSIKYMKKLFGEDIFADKDKLAKAIQLRLDGFSLYTNNNTKRQAKFKFKTHVLNLIEGKILEETDVVFDDKAKEEKVKEDAPVESTETEIEDESTEQDTTFDMNYLKDKWGYGYPKPMLYAFEKKYLMLKNNYPEKTALHTEALLTYIRYRVNEENATAKGDVKSAKEWGALADKQAGNAKININQLSKSDLSDGLDSFGTLVKMVETAKDIIPILPKFKKMPQDDVDFTMYEYINYVRDLKGLPPCKYEELYGFYDERKKEYEARVAKELTEQENEGEEDG